MSFRLPRKVSSERSLRYACGDFGDSMTEQSHAESADINNIMKRYEQTGIAPGYGFEPQFGDFSSALDFHDVQNKLIAAQDSFMSLPAAVRSKFDNDPGKFIEFYDNPENRGELVKMGLISEAPVPDATIRDVVDTLKSTKTPSPKKKSSSASADED